MGQYAAESTGSLIERYQWLADTDEGDSVFEELHHRAEKGDRLAASEVLNDYNVEDPDWTYQTGKF